jgi:hypothetical protein
VGDDCPIFDGMFDYCSISAGGSMGETAVPLFSASVEFIPRHYQRAPRD